MKKMNRRNIILIGFMGSGKTSVGERLASQISFDFKDTDQLIEQIAGTAISHIFEEEGEEYFRDMETNLLKELQTKLDDTVLSTGGGLPIREQNSDILKDLGFVVYLKTSKDTIVKRLLGDQTRPLLQGEKLEDRVERLLTVRAPIYEQASHKIIETDERSLEEMVLNIIEAYNMLV